MAATRTRKTCILCGNDTSKEQTKHCSIAIGQRIFGGVLMPFDIHTALKQLDVTLKQVKRTRAQLPKLNREKVDHELKILLLDLQLLQQDLIYMRDNAKKEIQND